MPSKELTNEVSTFLRNISVSSDNGGSYDEYECKEKAEELLSIILAALQEPSEHMLAEAMYLDRPIYVWRAMLAASALGEQSE
ncbi:hypothetical protein EDF68_10358 [Ochrobactrum sp. BH3]|nr:hypothetical protein EDF68_10358 [Ochrobactrum sp. BH3]